MPNRVASGPAAHVRTPDPASTRKKSSLGGPVIAPSLKRKDAFDATRPRADGSLLLGRRNSGPGEVVLTRAGDLTLEGKKGPAAAIEVARLIETGVSPFKHASEAQREHLVKALVSGLEKAHSGKSSSGSVMNRSSAATLLLSLARVSGGATREQALAGYVNLLEHETHLPLKTSMLSNLDAAHLPLKKAQSVQVEAARDVVQPAAPPYQKWFGSEKKPHLEVRQYVMEDFWKEETAGNKKRGFKIVSEKPNEIVFERVLKDPHGKAPDTTVRVVMRKDDKDVLRDLDDPKVHMVVYSGHAQLGGIADSAVRAGPDRMKGDKLVALFNCRGQQNVAQFKEKYPEAHLSATYSSSYGSDDTLVLDKLYQTIAARGDYAGTRKSLQQSDMLQPKSNYILPDDTRQIAYHDDDMDGLRDTSAIGPDRFFDPGRLKAHGGANVFRPSMHGEDPQKLSGVKLDHAIGYANTAFFYFAEENKAAPITLPQTDRFLAGGWFVSDSDEPVRIVEKPRNGKTWFEVSVSSRYADKSREVITSTVLMELQKYLCEKEGRFDADDKLRALVMVAGYLDLHADYSDQIDEVLSGFAKKYGFSSKGPLDYDFMWKALKNDGEDGTATKKTLDFLKSHGVAVA